MGQENDYSNYRICKVMLAHQSPTWLCTNVCHIYTPTDVVRQTAYLWYDLFTTSLENLWPVVRTGRMRMHRSYKGNMVAHYVPPCSFLFLFWQLF